MEFSNFSVWADTRDETQILFDISGIFPFGNLIGILGSSGAGKTTLLNVLSGFKNSKMKGRINVNGSARNLKGLRKSCCYVTQANDLNEMLTVEENMKFAVDLKLETSVDQHRKVEKIYQILETFGLYETLKARTCNLSGGQMKRLAIALEVISDPEIIFLDEPTSGLDSFASLQCMEYLKFLSERGKTVICTIHQPSATLFKLFNHVYILEKGTCLFQGHSEKLIPFLDHIGLPCNLYHNPADHVMELATGVCGYNNIRIMMEAVQNGKNKNYIKLDSNIVTSKIITEEVTVLNKKSNIFEIGILLRKEFLKLKRNMILTYLRILGILLINATVIALFGKLGQDASKIWFNYNYVTAVITGIVSVQLLTTVLTFPLEKDIIRKEYFNGYFSLKNYFMVITILDIPLSVIAVIPPTFLVYYFTDQILETERILMFLLIGFQLGIVAQSLGLLLGCLFNLKNAAFLSSYIHVPFMVVSGYGLTLRDIPYHFKWFSHLSYLRYGVNGMVGAIYGYNRTKLHCPEEKYCIFTNSENFMQDLGVEGYNFCYDSFMLFCFYLVLRIASYLSMQNRLTQN